MTDYKVLKSYSVEGMESDIKAWSKLGYELVSVTPIKGLYGAEWYLVTMKKG